MNDIIRGSMIREMVIGSVSDLSHVDAAPTGMQNICDIDRYELF